MGEASAETPQRSAYTRGPGFLADAIAAVTTSHIPHTNTNGSTYDPRIPCINPSTSGPLARKTDAGSNIVPRIAPMCMRPKYSAVRSVFK